MATTDIYFITAINRFSYPTSGGPISRSYDLDYHPLTTIPTIPIPWTSTGSPNFTLSGMEVDAGDYISCADIGVSDILIDINVEGQDAAGVSKILDFVESDGSYVSVWIDFDNHEIWMDDVVGSLRTGFRPGIKDIHSTFFRLTTRLIDGEFITRLYSAFENSPEPPTLQQTAGPSTTNDIANAGRLRIGNLSGPSSFVIHSLQIKVWPYPGAYNTTPDIFYPFPQAINISPTNGQLSGEDRLRLSLSNSIDIGVGGDLLFYGFSSNDISLGDATTTITSGELNLIINSIGTAKRRFLSTYSGDRPSGVHLAFEFQADNSVLTSPPQTEVIVGAVEYGVDGVVYAIQMVAGKSLGVVFRVTQTDGGVTQLSQNMLSTTQANHTLEFVRGGNVIELIVDGTQVLKSFIPDGPGVVAMYSTSTTVVNLTSKFTSFKARPVLLIGDRVATLV